MEIVISVLAALFVLLVIAAAVWFGVRAVKRRRTLADEVRGLSEMLEAHIKAHETPIDAEAPPDPMLRARQMEAAQAERDFYANMEKSMAALMGYDLNTARRALNGDDDKA